MTAHQSPSVSVPIASRRVIIALSCAAGSAVFLLALFLRLVYDDWMHRNRSLHLLGSAVLAVIVAVTLARRQLANRRRKLEILQRFETIKWMNDRIRNALQAIECVTYAAAPEATEAVRSSVNSIEAVLHEVLAESHPAMSTGAETSRQAARGASFEQQIR